MFKRKKTSKRKNNFVTTKKRRLFKKKDYSSKETDYISELKELYPLCKHDWILSKNDNNTNYDGHKIVYGEMSYEGIETLYSITSTPSNSIKNKFDAFIDIGSGRGKLCLYLASKPYIKKSIGIELVTQRHDDAVDLKNKLALNYPIYTQKASFVNSNIFDINLAEMVSPHNNVFIWFSNLCFEQDTTNLIFDKIFTELPKGTIVCCSKPYKGTNTIELIDTQQIPMSWSTSSLVYIHKIS